jgi:hypothetical protein
MLSIEIHLAKKIVKYNSAVFSKAIVLNIIAKATKIIPKRRSRNNVREKVYAYFIIQKK